VFDALGPNEGMNFMSGLSAQDFIFADTWSKSYGLFQKGPLKMSFSYLTSAVYHWQAEKNEDFQPVVFKEPLPVQVEYMGVPANCRMCAEGEAFLRFLLEPGPQSLIMQKNYMFPVRAEVRQGTVFEKLPAVSVLPARSSMTEEWLREALDKVSR
jgi:thiamine transport system substrate-binding protein